MMIETLKRAAVELDSVDDRREALEDLLAFVTTPCSVGGIPLRMESYKLAAAHMAAGQKIQAIKVIRTQTGLGLRDAKMAVEAEWG
jgi:DUF1365 family protein|tara:strand:- start:1406 stop:1663 length:258 start_codon:yes stop_codon:yes gene_type:complete